MKHIVTDLDGVLRDLMGYINARWTVSDPYSWHWKVDGKNIFDLAEENPDIIFMSPKTQYFDTIVDYFKPGKVEIWSAQIPAWRSLTKAWCDKHIGADKYTLQFLSPKEKYKKLISQPNTLLIEDSPNFEKYDQIILIDVPQNQKVDAEVRVKTPEELQKILNNIS